MIILNLNYSKKIHHGLIGLWRTQDFIEIPKEIFRKLLQDPIYQILLSLGKRQPLNSPRNQVSSDPNLEDLSDHLKILNFPMPLTKWAF